MDTRLNKINRNHENSNKDATEVGHTTQNNNLSKLIPYVGLQCRGLT